MKISRLIVRGYQQFEDLDLDLTNPLTKEPLDRVCLLGSNGTGKSTLLGLVRRLLHGPQGRMRGHAALIGRDGTSHVLSATGGWQGDSHRWFGPLTDSQLSEGLAAVFGGTTTAFPKELRIFSGLREAGGLIATVSADRASLLEQDPPRATLNQALALSKGRPFEHDVGPHQAEAFWQLLTALLARRNEQFREFLAREENRKRTVEDVETTFSQRHPELLPTLAALWNRLLEPAGLELDLENVKLPSQLTDSLSMHVRVARTKAVLPYNALSSGLRSFLFRLGYLKTLFFDPPTGSCFVLVDEPEASLHPDFLYDIVDVYQSVCLGSQLFFATHSPIVAAQFKPEERVILEFDENRFVKARRGTAPEGDDPNDVLRSDFHVRSVLGKEGVKKWERFLELDELLRREQDTALREKYRREYMEIGAAYNFEPRVHA